MRLLIVAEVFPPSRGGVQILLTHLLHHLRSKSEDVLVIAPRDSVPSLAGYTAAMAYGFPLSAIGGSGIAHYSTLTPSLMKRIWTFQPDQILFVDPIMLGLQVFTFVSLLLPGVPIVLSYNINTPGYSRVFGFPETSIWQWKMLRVMHESSVLTYTPSKSIETRLLRQQGWTDHKMLVWGRGVDGNLFNPQKRSIALRQKWIGGSQNESKEIILMTTSLLSTETGLDTLAQVFQALESSNSHLLIVGDKPYHDDLSNKFDSKADRVIFTGWVEGDDLATAMASADIFLFPSLIETHGVAVLEAMASGLPSVVFNVDGVKDLVEHDVTGLHSTAGDLPSFRRNIQRLIDSPQLRKEMGARARASAIRDYSWKDFYRTFDTACLIAQQEQIQIPYWQKFLGVVDIFIYYLCMCIAVVLMSAVRSGHRFRRGV